MIVKFQNTIALKIGVLLLLIIMTLLANYGVLTSKINDVQHSVERILKISNNSIIVLELNKDIVELQRDVTVFGNTGSTTIFAKMMTTHASIKSRLEQVQRQTENEKLLKTIQYMNALVARYGENLEVLVELYQVKSNYIDGELPEVFHQGVSVFNKIKDVNSSQKLLFQILVAHNIWLQMERGSTLFFNKKQFEQRRVVTQSIDQLKEKLTELSQTTSSDTKIHIASLLELTERYQTLFGQSVQANRNFLGLINVVMAGDAVEFTNLAKELKTQSLGLLNSIKRAAAKTVEITEIIIKGSIGVGMILFLGFALFFQLHITAAIKRLTHAFQLFLTGDFSPKISDTERKDEIGLLAIAASEFKNMNENLLNAKREAEKTSKIKTEFLANMSHEIRTPMNGILGMVNLLGKTTLSPQQGEMVGVIESSGRSLMVVLNDILDISKIESGKVSLEQKSFKFNDVIIELRYMFEPLAAEKNIELNITSVVELEEIDVVGDVTRLKQVMINLLSNAVKFTEHGGVTLRINVDKLTDEDVCLNIAVVDTGIGIEHSSIKKLFDAFSQADTSITRRFGGTGLGLTISSRLLMLMSAPLKVESMIGKGSKFSFSLLLPINKTQAVQTDVKNDDIHIDSSMCVLIAEDNKINQTVLSAMLKGYGFKDIKTADNGQIAVQLCREFEFDIIFMDMQMPIMDGLTATLEIRNLLNYKSKKIVALTANVLPEDRQSCFDAGMDEFLAKPIEAEELKRVLIK